MTNVLFVIFIVGTTDATGVTVNGQRAAITGGVRTGLPHAVKLDNSWTFKGYENEHDPQVDIKTPLASRRSLNVEREEIRTTCSNVGENDILSQSDAESGSVGAQNDLLAAWLNDYPVDLDETQLDVIRTVIGAAE